MSRYPPRGSFSSNQRPNNNFYQRYSRPPSHDASFINFGARFHQNNERNGPERPGNFPRAQQRGHFQGFMGWPRGTTGIESQGIGSPGSAYLRMPENLNLRSPNGGNQGQLTSGMNYPNAQNEPYQQELRYHSQAVPHHQMHPPNIGLRMGSMPPIVPKIDYQNMVLQRPPWLPQEGLQGSRPVQQNHTFGHYETRKMIVEEEKDTDKEFLKGWLMKRNIKPISLSTRKENVKLWKLRSDILSYLKCIRELGTCREVLLRFANTDEDNWHEIVDKTKSIQENLEDLQKKLFDNENLKKAKVKIKKRQKKRERQKYNRERRAKEKEEKQRRTILSHQKIDEWRHKIVSEIRAKKMVDSLKSEAGQSLAEVRKKIFECTKCLEKVDGTMELRGIRRQTALQRGIFIFGDQDEKFKKRLEAMKDLLKERLELYKSEEKTLRVMLEEEQEQRQREDDSKRKELMEKEHLRLFGYNPLLECRRYWLQAEENPMSLVQIRRLWDVYLVPDAIVGADHIPDGWVIPEADKNSPWNRFLKKKK